MFNPAKLAKALRTLRRKHRLSLNQLAQATGISRRTLARLESGFYHHSRVTSLPRAKSRGHKSPRLSPRTAMKLARLLLPHERVDAALDASTRLSRAYARDLGGPRDAYRLLDLLPDFFPAFLFHSFRRSKWSVSGTETPSEAEGPAGAFTESAAKRAGRSHGTRRDESPAEVPDDPFAEFAADYRDAFLQLLRLPPRNLAARLRAFRLRHDLTLVETADLLDLSKSELHRLERGQRRPSPRTAYRLLRLLTLPLSPPAFPASPLTGGQQPRMRAGTNRSSSRRKGPSSPGASTLPRSSPSGGKEPWPRGARPLPVSSSMGGKQPWPRAGTRRTSLGGQRPSPGLSALQGGQLASPRAGKRTAFSAVSPSKGGKHTLLRVAKSRRSLAGGHQPQPGEGLRSKSGTHARSPGVGQPRRADRRQQLRLMKTLLRQPPPLPVDEDPLRYLWLTSNRSTRQLAADLDISQPHLIRLLRGDRQPSRALRERIATLPADLILLK